MSRRFNFMPSRFVTDASRHVTPRHGDASRSERDIDVTEGGQVADKTRTDGGFPRDNHGTDAAVTGDTRRANALVTRDAPMTDSEREAAAERRADISMADYRARKLLEGLGQMRIMGRHSEKPIPAFHLDYFFKHFDVPADKGRAAYEAGQKDRARGVRCLCQYCGGMRASFAEEARQAYRTSRFTELQRQGMRFEEIVRQIEIEISRGDAH